MDKLKREYEEMLRAQKKDYEDKLKQLSDGFDVDSDVKRKKYE